MFDFHRDLSQRVRILVIDPEEAFSSRVTELLHDEGHEVRSVPDLARAMAAGDEFSPDVVMLTLGCERDGEVPAAIQIQQSSWGASTILVAVIQDPDDFVHARRSLIGVKLYLMKPVAPDILRMVVQLACRTEGGEARDSAEVSRLVS